MRFLNCCALLVMGGLALHPGLAYATASYTCTAAGTIGVLPDHNNETIGDIHYDATLTIEQDASGAWTGTYHAQLTPVEDDMVMDVLHIPYSAQESSARITVTHDERDDHSVTDTLFVYSADAGIHTLPEMILVIATDAQGVVTSRMLMMALGSMRLGLKVPCKD